jgi:hypothetical protein
MASLFVIRGQLAAIRSQLLQMPVFSSGRPDSTDAAGKQAAQLEKIGDQLELILRDLKSSQHLALLQLDNIRKVPPEHRFAAKQSAEQKSRDLADVAGEAEKLVTLVKDLLRRNGLISPIQAAKNTMDLIQDLEKHLPLHTRTSTQQHTNVPTYTSPDAGLPHVESLVPLVTLVYVAIRYWKDKYSKGKGNN